MQYGYNHPDRKAVRESARKDGARFVVRCRRYCRRELGYKKSEDSTGGRLAESTGLVVEVGTYKLTSQDGRINIAYTGRVARQWTDPKNHSPEVTPGLLWGDSRGYEAFGGLSARHSSAAAAIS